MKRTILVIFFFLLCLGTLFLKSSSFVNSLVAPKVYAFLFCFATILIIVAVYTLFSDVKKLRLDDFVLPVCLTTTTLITFQALYGIAQYMRLFPAFEIYRVTGSFDNPAGFASCLCAGFPFFSYFLLKKERWIRVVSIVGMIIVGFAVFLSSSRAGMLALAVVCILGIFWINTKQKIIAGIFLVVLTTGLYFLKKDSADGRLLIWRCSWEMVKNRPIAGYGQGGFKANYMNFQSQYFKEHPDSKQVMVADNINRPFNEYLGLLVNYGLIGFLLFSLLLFFIIRSFRRITEKILFTHIAGWCLTAIAIFALFSYPLRYPFVWTVGILSCLTILFQGNKRWLIPCILHRIPRTIFPVFILFLALIVCSKSYSQLTTDIKWCKIAHRSLAGQTEQMLPEYQSLHAKLYNNELFLYNYAAELNFSGHYKESQTIASECERHWADYDLQMLMADNYQQLKDYAKAERCYRKAAAMCPAKFAPLYNLAKMYDAIGQEDEATALAEQIVNKSIKIASPNIVAIQREMRQLIEKVKNNKLQHENTRQGNTPDGQPSDAALPP